MGLFRRKPTVDPAQLAALATELAELRAQLQVLDRRLDAASADDRDTKVAMKHLQERMGSIGSELANQLTELSGDIDALQARPDPTAAIAAVDGLRRDVDGLGSSLKGVEDDAEVLRTGQERLANEQARYQIAFREDLAALGDQVARKRA